MTTTPLIIIGTLIVIYGLFSNRFSYFLISAPMLFMLAGLGVGSFGLNILTIDVDNHILEGFAELTLGLILFADAAATDSRRLLRDNRIPLRLLLIALPLTIGLGTAIAYILFPQLSLAQHALIAAILAPTDAALGLAVINSKAVPERIRQSILVESGLNDGLALPAVLLFAALALSAMAEPGHGATEVIGQTANQATAVGYWLGFSVQQIAIGILCGLIGGWLFGEITHYADDRNWIAHEFRNLTSLGAAIMLLLGTHLVHGNGFIAAFVGGLVFGSTCQYRAIQFTSFVEEEGQLFSLLVFFFFGAVILPAAIPFITVMCVAYAVLSLTVIRMVPTLLALIGAKLSLPGQLFIGWFGPRGLASILFLFIAIGPELGAQLSQVESIVYITVFLSVIVHGITAPLFSALYAKSHGGGRDNTHPVRPSK